MEKCDTCLNAREIISENGYHSICTLSSKAAVDCMLRVKDHYIRHPGIREEKDVPGKT
jgi:hypothetical protein